MTKKKTILLVMVVACVFTSFSIAGAENMKKDHLAREHADRWMREIFSKLNVSDEQKEKLRKNKQEHRAREQEARGKIKIIKEALQTELMKVQLDMAKIKALHEQVEILQAGMEDDKLESILVVRAILTQEQFASFVNLMHKHKQLEEQHEPAQ